jgi:hypothetical protein
MPVSSHFCLSILPSRIKKSSLFCFFRVLMDTRMGVHVLTACACLCVHAYVHHPLFLAGILFVFCSTLKIFRLRELQMCACLGSNFRRSQRVNNCRYFLCACMNNFRRMCKPRIVHVSSCMCLCLWMRRYWVNLLHKLVAMDAENYMFSEALVSFYPHILGRENITYICRCVSRPPLVCFHACICVDA